MISKLYFTKRINFHRFILFSHAYGSQVTYRCFNSPSDEKARRSSRHRLWQLRSQLTDKQAKKNNLEDVTTYHGPTLFFLFCSNFSLNKNNAILRRHRANDFIGFQHPPESLRSSRSGIMPA